MHRLFKAIVTHFRVDSDELTAIYLAIRFGFNLLFGKRASVLVEFTDAGTRTPDGMTAKTWMEQGFLPFGIGGREGPFDEHQDGSHPRKQGECAATLTAKFLGISENPKIKTILKYILDCDNGNQSFCPDGLSVLVKVLHWQYPNDPHIVMDWFFQALDAKYGDNLEPDNFTLGYIYEQLVVQGYAGADDWYQLAHDAMAAQETHLHTVTADEFLKNSEILSVVGPYGKKVKVAVVKSDDELICRYAFSKLGGRCKVLIQKKSSGHVQIFSNKQRGIFLDKVAPVVRKLEMVACGRHSNNPRSLGWEGNGVYGAECWCFMHRMFMFNGSLTAPNAKRTKLTMEQIVEGVCKGLAVQKAKQKHPENKSETMAA